jgi:hypothetical protein
MAIGNTIIHRKMDRTIFASEGIEAKLDMLIEKHDETTLYLETLIQRNATVSRSRLLRPPIHQHQALPSIEAAFIDQEQLWRLLDIDDLDLIDLEEVSRKSNQLPASDRAQTEQIVHKQEFQEWVVTPTSTKLLVYANFSGLMMETSALSLFCTTLAKAFRPRPRYLCLVWFCGRHVGHDDTDSDWSDSESDSESSIDYDPEDDYSPETRERVIKKMVRSLIAQLLCDYDFQVDGLLPPEIDPNEIGWVQSLSQLRRLFCWLVRQLPEDITLFCLLDGIVFYEREEFEDPMLDVLGDILELEESDDPFAMVKVLVTSPRPPSSTFRIGFENDDGSELGDPDDADSPILYLESMALAHVDVSDERMERNLAGIAVGQE